MNSFKSKDLIVSGSVPFKLSHKSSNSTLIESI